MTAVPSGDNDTMCLLCDRCGDTLTARYGQLRDAELVWPLLREHGWSGSAFHTGPHHCPRCTISAGGGVGRDARHRPPSRPRRPPAMRRIDVDRIRYATVVTPHADLVEEVTAELRAALAHTTGPGTHLLLDMGRVRVIDPCGLGVLVHAHMDAKRSGRLCCLAAPSRFVVTALHTMRLDGVFPIFADRRQALSWLAVAAPPQLIPG